MSHRWQQILAWIASVVVPLLVLITALITVLELERIRLHHLSHVSEAGVAPLSRWQPSPLGTNWRVACLFFGPQLPLAAA
jgi:hypothetical protein